MSDTQPMSNLLAYGKHNAPTLQRNIGYNEGLDAAIALIRSHEQQQTEVLGEVRDALAGCIKVFERIGRDNPKHGPSFDAYLKALSAIDNLNRLLAERNQG